MDNTMTINNVTMLYTVNEVAKIMHTNAAYVYKLIKSQRLVAIKLGSYKIRRETLDLGILLSEKIEEKIIDGKKVFIVGEYDVESTIYPMLIACFDENVTNETVTAIAKHKPYYFVMRDSSMATDSVATNFEQIFATYSADTVRKVL